ncbi:hypothetical protein EC973_007574 [Apophysomyces ossiformis]|uniref:Small EDRK-rich factor-like N-terminal domain-containing protein n=1 Tax=Apophysomyces ossiformis TaxID=679940 RepID=A0A8H7ERK2_9FUNG|nr:hypothetical protein EC973_007574 [Apophysomyces ossiformis]
MPSKLFHEHANSYFILVTIGGNQREQARLKNLKKQQEQKKGKQNLNGMTVTQKKESDAAIMRAKQEAAAAKKAAEGKN